jgi:hypothetical protein
MLTNTFYPKFSPELLRLGRDNDGGYVISSTSISDTQMILGLGLSDDWSFEEDMARRTGAEVVCVDHTVHSEFWRRKAILAFMKMFAFRHGPAGVVRQIATWFAYHRFFRTGGATHIRKKIGGSGSGGMDLRALLELCPDGGVFLKMDIEGWEYRILNQVIEYADRFSGVVIEFHDVDLHRERIEAFICELKLPLVHIHANNAASLDGRGDPMVLELTFGHQGDRRNPQRQIVSYPIVGVDQPNDLRCEDIELVFEK